MCNSHDSYHPEWDKKRFDSTRSSKSYFWNSVSPAPEESVLDEDICHFCTMPVFNCLCIGEDDLILDEESI